MLKDKLYNMMSSCKQMQIQIHLSSPPNIFEHGRGYAKNIRGPFQLDKEVKPLVFIVCFCKMIMILLSSAMSFPTPRRHCQEIWFYEKSGSYY